MDASRHVGCGPGFVDEHKPLGIKVELAAGVRAIAADPRQLQTREHADYFASEKSHSFAVVLRIEGRVISISQSVGMLTWKLSG